MSEVFGYSLGEYIFYGGYPEIAQHKRTGGAYGHSHWISSYRDSILENDLNSVHNIHRPALIKSFLGKCIQHSGEIIGLNQLLTAADSDYYFGNIQTLQSYAQLFSQAGVATALPAYHPGGARKRRSMPKLLALNSAFVSAARQLTYKEAYEDRIFWPRLVRTAVGAHLWNTMPTGSELFYWRDSQSKPPREIDFILMCGDRIIPLQICDSQASKAVQKTLAAFEESTGLKPLLVAQEGTELTLEDFFLKSAEDLLEEHS